MESVNVSININAPIDKVFDAISDHEGYANLIGMRSVKLIKHGQNEKNGKGAVRELNAPGITFVEAITEFEKNKFYEYKVIHCYADLGFMKIDIPLVHKLGRVTCESNSRGVHVNWISDIEIDIPIAKEIAAKVFCFLGSESFLFMLRQIKFKLEFS